VEQLLGPMVRSFLSDALPHLGVERDIESQMDLDYTWLDPLRYPVPNFIGMHPSDVRHNQFTIKIIGDGDVVIDQLPRVGSRLQRGKTIIILT